MEHPRGYVVYPSFDDICAVNRRMIDASGGSFCSPANLSNPEALQYALDALSASVFGHELYPSLEEKAAALAQAIISRHVFRDGNKRTAVHVMWELLRANGVPVYLDITVAGLARRIAAGEATYEDLLCWLRVHTDM